MRISAILTLAVCYLILGVVVARLMVCARKIKRHSEWQDTRIRDIALMQTPEKADTDWTKEETDRIENPLRKDYDHG